MTSLRAAHAPVVLVVLLAACSNRDLPVSRPATGEEIFALTADWPAFNLGAQGPIDILFMVDNSLSMKPLQKKLVDGFSAFMTSLEALPGGTPDLHIGVVSSDMGAGAFDVGDIPGCRRGGDGGRLQSTPHAPCVATGLADPFIALHTDLGTGQLVTNFGAQALPDIFSCIALIGDNGCGFEHQFSSVRHALDPGLAPAENTGFLRREAFLAVVLITNEDDCSAPGDSMLFDPYSSRFVSDPLGPLASYRCNEFGHVCSIGGKLQHPPRTATGELQDCQSAEDGKLDKVSDFVGFLQKIKGDPAKVFLAVVGGPPTPYTVATSQPVLHDDRQQWPFIEHSCTAMDGTYADPGVRLAQAARAFGTHGLYESICGDSMGPILQEISSSFSRPLAAACVPTPDPAGPGCTVIDRWADDAGTRQAARLPSCTEAAGALPCWELVVDRTCAPANRLRVNRAPDALAQNVITAIDCSAPHP
jgi:hypothetical protein